MVADGGTIEVEGQPDTGPADRLPVQSILEDVVAGSILIMRKPIRTLAFDSTLRHAPRDPA